MNTDVGADSPSLFKHPGFLEYWCSRLNSMFAFQMLSVAVGWQIYDLTHRALDLGLIGLVQFVPSFVLALPAGHVADIFERRRIVLICQAVEGAATLPLAVGSWLRWFDEPAILAIVFIIGCARAFEFPTMQALLPSMVPAPLLSRAMAAGSSASMTAMIVGPALGGLLYVAGAGTVYGVSGLLFVIAAVLMWLLKLERPPQRREPATLKSVFAGIRFVRHRPVVLGAISLDLFAVLLGGATALLPVYARDILHVGPVGLGILRSAPAVGAALVAFSLGRRPLENGTGAKMFGAVVIFGIATIVFGVSTNFYLSLVALFVLGASDMVSVFIRSALIQFATPDPMRGRVSAVNMLFIGASNELGEFEDRKSTRLNSSHPSISYA